MVSALSIALPTALGMIAARALGDAIVTGIGAFMTRRAVVRRKLPADSLAALRALIDILDGGPGAVASFLGRSPNRPIRAPAELAQALRSRPRRLATKK